MLLLVRRSEREQDGDPVDKKIKVGEERRILPHVQEAIEIGKGKLADEPKGDSQREQAPASLGGYAAADVAPGTCERGACGSQSYRYIRAQAPVINGQQHDSGVYGQEDGDCEKGLCFAHVHAASYRGVRNILPEVSTKSNGIFAS